VTRVVLRLIFHRVITLRTPFGRKMPEKILSHRHNLPLVRTEPRNLTSAAF
jgi:hypothetical protein